jgi:hypothetical protein
MHWNINNLTDSSPIGELNSFKLHDIQGRHPVENKASETVLRI